MRRAAALAIALGFAHVIWLIVAGPGSWWISIPFLVLELWGLAQFGLRTTLVWQPLPARKDDAPITTVDRVVDLVVTCTFQSPEDLERTLVSCRSVRHARRTIVALQSDREELMTVARAFDVEIQVTGGNHVDAFWHAAQSSEFVLWLEAGQVPTPRRRRSGRGIHVGPDVRDALCGHVHDGATPHSKRDLMLDAGVLVNSLLSHEPCP